MDTVENIDSQSSTNAEVKQENSTYATPFTPKDDGVAIPCAEVAENGGTEALVNIQSSDTQNIENKTISTKSSKIVKVRTFSDSIWYVANVHTNCEQKTQQIIEHFDQKHRVNVWLPMQVEIRNVNDTLKVSQRLDITNYLFFHLSQSDERDEAIRAEILRDIRSITYVNDLLIDSTTQKLATIPNSQIAAFKKMLSDDRYPVRFIPDMIAVGMKMRVKSGNLRGLEGTVESITPGETNVYITLDHLGCAVAAVPTKLLEPVTTPDQIVTMHDWLTLHPNKQNLSVDKCYVDFANITLGVLEECSMPVYGSKRKRMALSLAYYLEDKKSYLGVFDYFVRMQFRGVIHPLQLLMPVGSEELKKYMADYDATRINVIDLMYFLRANDNGKPRTLDVINQKAITLKSAIERIGCKKLNSNVPYKQHLVSMLQADDLAGLRRFVSWLDNCVKLFSYGEFSQPETKFLFCKCYNVEPLSFALQLSIKMKAKESVKRLIKTMLNEPQQLYEIVGCFRKAIHLKSSDGINHIVYLDNVSAGNYVIGEHYNCRIVEVDENKWYMIEPPVKATHKVQEYRDITAENLALLTADEFLNANLSFVETISGRKETIVSNKWLHNEDIDEYVTTFRKAKKAKDYDYTTFSKHRKATEEIIVRWNQGELNPKREDVCDNEFYEITDALYLNTQHTDYLTDAQWQEKYKGLTADKRSEVVAQRKAAEDCVDFPNPYHKEMEAAWRLPEGYDDEQVQDALSPLAEYLPKAMQLYEKGEAIKALGVCFDLLDMLVVLKSRELKFFIDDENTTMYSWTLADVALYPICKIYNDTKTSQEVKAEIHARIEAYIKQYNFPDKFNTSRPYEPEEVLLEFGTFDRELDFYDFFDQNPYNIHEPEEAEPLSDEEYDAWQQKIYREVLDIQGYGKLSTEVLSRLGEILAGMYLYHSDIEKVCSLDHYNSCLDGVKSELLSRLGKSTDLAEQSMIFFSLCEMARVSIYKFTGEVIVKEKEFIGSVQSAKDIDHHILHAALLLMRRVPLADSKPDSQGNLNYTFSLEQDFYEQTLRSWASSQNENGSWTDVSADEAYGRIFITANDFGAIKDIDNARVTYLGYNYYCPTPCVSPKELYAKFMAYESKYRRPDETSPAFIHRQAIAMLESEGLALVDRLLLYSIIL